MRFSAATSGTQHRGSKPMISSSTWASVTSKLGIRSSITPPRNGSLGMFIPTPSRGSGARSSVPLSEPSTKMRVTGVSGSLGFFLALSEEIRRSEFSAADKELGGPKLTPVGKCSGAVELEMVP